MDCGLRLWRQSTKNYSSTITRVCIVCIVGSYVWILTMDAPTSHHTHVLVVCVDVDVDH